MKTTPAFAPPPYPALAPEEREQRFARQRAESIQQATALLKLPVAEAAAWLAKWLIHTDVERGYSETDIALGHQSYSGSLGMVAVIVGRKIEVQRIGASGGPAWADYPTGYDYRAVFRLHVIYEELRAELAEKARPVHQLSLWQTAEEVSV